MTVLRLIQHLQECPLDATVFINPLENQHGKPYIQVGSENVVIVEKQDLSEFVRSEVG